LSRFIYHIRSLPDRSGQGLIEYALILSLVSIVVLVVLALVGPVINSVYCQVIRELPGTGNACGEDVVAIKNAEYHYNDNPLEESVHLDMWSNGDYFPDTILTASPGGVMEARAHHYHLDILLSGCHCKQTITITSSAGGFATVEVGPP
jgi:pilus assembly protein Flp/PilA